MCSLSLIASTGMGLAFADHLPVDSDPDVTAPVVESISITPTEVDVRTGSATITATANITDDKSGVDRVSVTYQTPSGGSSVLFQFTSFHRVSGDAHVGVYVNTVAIDNDFEAGTWQVGSGSTRDVVGNTRGYTATELTTLGASPITIQSNRDAVAPQITAVRVTPGVLDVGSANGAVTFEVDATDAGGSGVWLAQVFLRSPSGRQVITAQPFTSTRGLEAATLSGQGATSTPTPTGSIGENGLSQYSEPGTWTVTQLVIIDHARNQTRYLDEALEPLVPDPFFEVVSDPTDTGNPLVTAFRFEPHAIDVSSGPATVNVEFDVADELSGVQAAYLTFRSPSISASPPFIDRSAIFYQPMTGIRITDDTVHASVQFPRFDRGGDWTVNRVCVIDRVKHLVCYSGTALEGIGPTEITVISNRLALTPATAEGQTGTPHTVTATVTNQDGPIVGGSILFAVSGANSGSGNGVTDSAGEASHTYTGTNQGIDTISACYDRDGTGVCEPGELTATASMTWTQPTIVDQDADGVPDGTDNCPTLANPDQADLNDDGEGDVCDPDIDGDGLSNVIEIWLGCDPYDPDTDDDGVWDGVEVVIGTNPLLPDTDDDGEGDGGWLLRVVHQICGCGVGLEDDENGNGVFDVVEYFYFGGLYDPDRDGGGGSSLLEYIWHLCGCGPDDPDGNGIPQAVEKVWGGGGLLRYIVHCGCTPWDDPDGGGGLRIEFIQLLGGNLGDDPDGDGLITVIEILLGCNPLDPDTDGDGLWDRVEIYVYGTDPLDEDTDGDGMHDGREIELGCDPLDPDTDGDGQQDGSDPAPLALISACHPSKLDPVAVGALLTATATLGGQVSAGSIAWGDGTATSLAGAGSHSIGHQYGEAGVYTVTCTVTDTTGGTQFVEHRYVVVYDPDGGFVTGGGWIRSPAGAYPADPSLVGDASFGFVSKYKKGAATPTGQTEFQFRVANLNFHSASYQWLVVAGTRAQYKGTGTINGAGSYGFMLTAIDGQARGGDGVDRFRMKIWDMDDGDRIVYDNELGRLDGADPSTALSGGSIVIHAKK
jgi:hypothetical protein